MLSIRAHKLLSSIQEQGIEGMTTAERDLLAGLDLIKAINSTEYRALEQDADRVKDVECYLDSKKTHLQQDQAIKRILDAKLASLWHRFWSGVTHCGHTELNAEKQECESIARRISMAKANVELLETKRKQLQARVDQYSKFRPCGNDDYCAITDEGVRMHRTLQAALPRLEGIDIEMFVSERDQLWHKIHERLDKINVALKYLKSIGFSNDRRVRRFASSIAAADDSPEEIWQRAKIVNDYLYNKEWQSYNRLQIASTVMRYEGNTEQLRDDLVETFLIMVNDGHSRCYGTWWEAANVMRFPGQTLKDRYSRFEALQQELGKRQWRARSSATGYIAVHLGRQEGTPAELADKFRELEKAIVATGRNDCVESGIAAVILLDTPGSDAEKAERFTSAFEAIQQHGWAKRTDRYPVAAVVAAMPGTVEENALLLIETCEFLKNKKMGDNVYHLTDLALAILGSSYQAITQSHHTPSYIRHRYYSSGFSLEGAVVGGLIGGAEGAILGGLLWDWFF